MTFSIFEIILLLLGGAFLSIAAAMGRGIIEKKIKKRLALVAGCFFVLGAAISIFVNLSKREKPKWVSDEFLSVKVSNPAVGTILSEEAYEIKLDMKNESTMPMEVTKIVVQSKNPDAAKLFQTKSAQVFEANIHIPYSFSGNEEKTIPVRLNEILPKQLFVRVYHNRATAPSEFHIDVAGRVQPMPSPRYLSRDEIFRSYSSLEALKRATAKALQWSSDAQLVAMFPGTNSTMIDMESRLKFIISESWVTTFYSEKLNREYVAITSAKEVKGEEIQNPPENPRPTGNLPNPMLGFEQALDCANRSSLLSADWRGLRYGIIETESGKSGAWFLPYLATSGLPVIIDAVTGYQLVHADNGLYRHVSISPSPLSK